MASDRRGKKLCRAQKSAARTKNDPEPRVPKRRWPLVGRLLIGGVGRLTVDTQVAAAGWEPVGGAWAPGSERSPALPVSGRSSAGGGAPPGQPPLSRGCELRRSKPPPNSASSFGASHRSPATISSLRGHLPAVAAQSGGCVANLRPRRAASAPQGALGGDRGEAEVGEGGGEEGGRER
ncbi:hypothetical protein PVAP13_8KG278502 [Panicum virgatum]|uniref:Uncharacterized protein n=1 Tax=Panicum virgatum TaxID=38727 RepID=A0A8T0Q005_PANVG|nr:hypothetical protein PVAP13_8KG278502 [Panicum virgatum]